MGVLGWVNVFLDGFTAFLRSGVQRTNCSHGMVLGQEVDGGVSALDKTDCIMRSDGMMGSG